MNIIITGYGNMGKNIETILLERGHRIVCRVDPIGGDSPQLTEELARQADCAIEFSLPEAALANVDIYCRCGLNAVMATTGWYNKLDMVRAQVTKAKTGFIYGSNYSIGAHIFFRLVGQAAQIINNLPGYDILGYELHHSKKKDSPSGTALTTADIILKNNQAKTTLVTEKLDRRIEPHELHFASVRGGNIPGIHRVILDSAADSIELTHSARNRLGFALGAVLAAEWLKGKQGFFSVDDFITSILNK